MTDQELLQAIRAIVKEEAHPVRLLLENEIQPCLVPVSLG